MALNYIPVTAFILIFSKLLNNVQVEDTDTHTQTHTHTHTQYCDLKT
jgi:hypothetical protein